MYIIYWRSKITGHIGHGTKALSRKQAEQFIKTHANPDIVYWLVKFD